MSREHAPDRSKQLRPVSGRNDVDDTAEPLRPLPHQLYRFNDLKQRRIVESRAQLKKMVERDGFPPGFILTPQIRAWRADEIEQWLASRPTEQIEARGRAKALKENGRAA
jgi:hypothetical protein